MQIRVLHDDDKIKDSNEQTPNKETIKAIEDAENDINMTKCADADDMFKKLGI